MNMKVSEQISRLLEEDKPVWSYAAGRFNYRVVGVKGASVYLERFTGPSVLRKAVTTFDSGDGVKIIEDKGLYCIINTWAPKGLSIEDDGVLYPDRGWRNTCI